jgi:transposase
MSIQAITRLTGWDRKMIRKSMQEAGVAPEYGPRPAQPSMLDAFKPYLEERLRAGLWNARVLLRELRERNYTGSYTIPTDVAVGVPPAFPCSIGIPFRDRAPA